MIRAAVLAVMLAQDAGTSWPVYTVGDDARISQGFGPSIEVPPGKYVPQASWEHIDGEFKRLQYIEAHPPQPQGIAATGFVIAVVVGLVAGMAIGAGAAYAATR